MENLPDRLRLPKLSQLLRQDHRLRPVLIVVAYLCGITVAETATTLVEPRLGLLLHGVLFLGLLLHAASSWSEPLGGMLLTLAFAPLIRLLSYGLPLAGIPQIYWYFLISLPLFAASAVAVPILRYSPSKLGLRLGNPVVQLALGLSGLVLGYAEYRILTPDPLLRNPTLAQAWLAALILLVSTGFLEELIFRGLMQRTSIDALGRRGPILIALTFAVLHVGYKSLADVCFVLIVGLFFSWAAAATGSLIGVTLAHGLTNIMLFLVMPFVAVNARPPLLPPLAGLLTPSHVARAESPSTVSDLSLTFSAAQDGFIGAGRTVPSFQENGRASQGCTAAGMDLWMPLTKNLSHLDDSNKREAQEQRHQREVQGSLQRQSPCSLQNGQQLFLDQQRQKKYDYEQRKRGCKCDRCDRADGGSGDSRNHWGPPMQCVRFTTNLPVCQAPDPPGLHNTWSVSPPDAFYS